MTKKITTKKTKVKTVKKERPPYLTGGDFVKAKLESKILLAHVLTHVTSVDITDTKQFIKILVDNELYGKFINELKEIKTEAGFKSKVKKYLKQVPPEYFRSNKFTTFKQVYKDYAYGQAEVHVNGNRSTKN